MTTAADRRRDGRAAPTANWRIRLAQKISETADWFASSLYTKTLLGALLSGAIAVVCWAMLVQLQTANEYNRAIQHEVSLRLALEDLQAAVLRLQYQHLEDKIEVAEHKLIPDYGTLAKWLHDLQASSATRGIDLSYTVNEEQHLDSRPGLLAVPLTVTVQTREGERAQPYGEGLSLLRRLSEGPWAGELVAAYGEGEGRGLTRMNFEYHIWMRTRDGFDPDPSVSPTIDGEGDEGESEGADPPSLVTAQTSATDPQP